MPRFVKERKCYKKMIYKIRSIGDEGKVEKITLFTFLLQKKIVISIA